MSSLLIRDCGASRLACLASAMAVLFLSASVWNTAAFGAESEHACPAPSAGHPECYAILDKTKEGVKTYTAGSGELGGFDPSDLRSAYKLPSTGGSGQTVAVVDAYNDPNAESDLAAYRSHYGLSECTKENGCFKKVNQKGEEGSYPANEAGWSVEMSLDLDMVSAACPSCHILLVEANNTENVGELAAAANEAAKLGATEISNSYGLPEQYEKTEGSKGYSGYDSDYTHTGIPTIVSAGDEGYENWEDGAKSPSFPAAVPDVIAVGGTTLLPSEGGGREWAETVWTESGGGCSLTQTKPPWQTFDTGCEHRMDNDVAAVADPTTPVSIYDTYGIAEKWHDVGGTSVAAPFIAGVEALSSSYSRSLEGADAFYLDASHMFDITKGTNFPREEGCTPTSLCNAEKGYDGPSGNGTPDGAVEPAGHITEYSLPKGSGPYAITEGSDGNLWYADTGKAAAIGKITTSGTITEYSLSEKGNPHGIADGPDGNLWYTDLSTSMIGKITTSGSITEYALPKESGPHGIITGPDGNLWFTNDKTSKIGKITTSGTITEYALPKESEPLSITKGPDGNLWFTDRQSSKIGKTTTSGTITEYALPKESDPTGIAAGPDGNLWFTDNETSKIGKITTSGTITEYALPKESKPIGITQGPDKNLWFTDGGTGEVGNITTSGAITEYALPTGSEPCDITQGPDGNLWFADFGTSKIGKVTP